MLIQLVSTLAMGLQHQSGSCIHEPNLDPEIPLKSLLVVCTAPQWHRRKNVLDLPHAGAHTAFFSAPSSVPLNIELQPNNIARPQSMYKLALETDNQPRCSAPVAMA